MDGRDRVEAVGPTSSSRRVVVIVAAAVVLGIASVAFYLLSSRVDLDDDAAELFVAAVEALFAGSGVDLRWRELEVRLAPPVVELRDARLVESSYGQSAANARVIASADSALLLPKSNASFRWAAFPLGAIEVDGGRIVFDPIPDRASFGTRLTLIEFPLHVFTSWRGNAPPTGEIDGTIDLEGDVDPIFDPESIVFDLWIRDGSLSIEEINLRGDLKLTGHLERRDGEFTGRFEVDATDANLVVAPIYDKPPGVDAAVDGRIRLGAKGALEVEEVRYRAARARVSVGGGDD